MVAIPVTRSISIDSDELQESATRSGGAGGQHVNTTDSAVILRFDVGNSPNLPLAVKNRLAVLAEIARDNRAEGARLTLALYGGLLSEVEVLGDGESEGVK